MPLQSYRRSPRFSWKLNAEQSRPSVRDRLGIDRLALQNPRLLARAGIEKPSRKSNFTAWQSGCRSLCGKKEDVCFFRAGVLPSFVWEVEANQLQLLGQTLVPFMPVLGAQARRRWRWRSNPCHFCKALALPWEEDSCS